MTTSNHQHMKENAMESQKESTETRSNQTGQQDDTSRVYSFSTERALTAFAGFMVLLSVALTVWVHPNFIWLTVFIGVNLFQQSFTGFCPATIVMRNIFRMRSEREIALRK